MDLGDTLLKNCIRATPRMMVDEKADCAISFMTVSEYRTNQEMVTGSCGGSTAQQVDAQHPFEIAQFGSLIGFFAAAALVGIVGAVLLRRGRK
jgi:hypothetical protein